MIDRLVILGASGDLAIRHLLPAIGALIRDGEVPTSLSVGAVGRRSLSIERYRALVETGLDRAGTLDLPARDGLISRLAWHQVESWDSAALRAAIGSAPVVVYLALPPGAVVDAVRGLASAELAAGSRIAIEKPFGEDLASARALDALLREAVPQATIYRVDHFLHHRLAHNIVATRFANPLFDGIWDRRYIERVDVLWHESTGVEGRAEYYDNTGALRDMIQSHLLQILALVAMEPPDSIDGPALAEVKAAVLRSVQTPPAGAIGERTVRARYGAGSIGARRLAAYVATPGVDSGRGTETFAAVDLSIGQERWTGVPFRLEAGKAIVPSTRLVEIRFRPPRDRGIVRPAASHPAFLRFEMDPDRIVLGLSSASGSRRLVEPSELAVPLPLPQQTLPASARILGDLLKGDPTLSVSQEEVEESWRITDAIRAAWRSRSSHLREYPAGSVAPSQGGHRRYDDTATRISDKVAQQRR